MMIEKVMIQLGPNIYIYIYIYIKSSGVVKGAAPPPMMIEKVMIQLGAKNLKSSCRMMIDKVMIQLGVHFDRKGGGGGEELAMLRMQEAKAENWESRRAAELAMQRMRKAKAAKAAKTNRREL